MAGEEGHISNRFVRITGRLESRTSADYNVAAKCELAKGVVEADGMQFDVSAYGPLAVELASIKIGTDVEVEGDLVLHRWETGDRKVHTQCAISARRLIPSLKT